MPRRSPDAMPYYPEPREMMRHVGGGVPMMSATRGGNRSRQWDLEGLIEGDNVTAQTANGTSHATGTGWNWQYPYEAPQVPESPTHPGGRSNRTGE